MSIEIKRSAKGNTTKLSKNFKLSEFECNGSGCCNEVLWSLELVERLQWMRDRCKKAIVIYSAYRCPKQNRISNGVSNSKHILGMAADLKVPSGMTLDEFAALAEAAGFRGVLKYTKKNFVHVDVRETKPYYGLTETGASFKSMSTFGGTLMKNPGVKPNKTVKKGSKPLIFVLWIQYQLKQAGFDCGDLDGLYGDKTALAVRNFQAARGLKVDGICGMGETIPALSLVG